MKSILVKTAQSLSRPNRCRPVYNPTKPEIIHIDEEPTNVRPTASTDEKAIILDEHFKDGLCDLFGDVSSSDED